MTDQDAPTAQLGPEPPPEPQRPRLRRATEDRVLFGVAGGLGRHLDVDPVLVRVGFVVLALLGGAGVLLYLLLALVVPRDAAGGAEGAGEGAGGRGTQTTLGVVGIVAALGLVLLVFGIYGGGLFFFAPGLAFVVLLVVVAALLVRAMRGENASVAKILLALVVVFASGALGIAAAAGVAFGGGTIVAIVAVAVGVALVVAGVLGGARWLILPALAVAIPATVASASGVDLRGPLGNREFQPATQADIEPAYEVGVGRLAIDLRDVTFRGTTDVRLKGGMGQIEVLVPRGVCVSTVADTDAGDIDVFGRHTSGVDVAARERRTAKAGRPTLRLSATLTMGAVRVAHERFADRFGPRGEVRERQRACATS